MRHVVCWGERKSFFVSQRLVPCQLSGAPVISRRPCSEPCAETAAAGAQYLPHGCPEGPRSCLCFPSLPPPGSHLCVIKLSSGSSHDGEEQLCLKLSLQNVHADFIACTCRVWLLLWPRVPAACTDKRSLFLPSQLIALRMLNSLSVF